MPYNVIQFNTTVHDRRHYMHLLEDVGADHGVQVRVHELEDEVNVAVIVGLEDVPELDDVLVIV